MASILIKTLTRDSTTLTLLSFYFGCEFSFDSFDWRVVVYRTIQYHTRTVIRLTVVPKGPAGPLGKTSREAGLPKAYLSPERAMGEAQKTLHQKTCVRLCLCFIFWSPFLLGTQLSRKSHHSISDSQNRAAPLVKTCSYHGSYRTKLLQYLIFRPRYQVL